VSAARSSHLAVLGANFDALLWSSRRPGFPSAWHGHVAFMHWLVKTCAPRVAVELGTEHGVSYAAICHAVAALGLPSRCFAVDTWQGDAHTGAYGDTIHDDLKAFNDTHYAHFSTLMRCSFDAALPHFPDASIDLLHIDGLHTYAAVRHDFETWAPKLSPRGVVLFHDIAMRTLDFGVWQLWQELRQRYPSFSFEHSAGLGVLLVGAAPPPAVLALCRVVDAAEMAELRLSFAAFSEVAFHAGQRELELARLQLRLTGAETALRRLADELASPPPGQSARG
jgi:hypothetical protein